MMRINGASAASVCKRGGSSQPSLASESPSRSVRSLLAGSGANATRLKTPSEFRNRDREPGGRGFAGSLLRHVLYAVHMVARGEEPPPARRYLSETLTPLDYWDKRQTILALLDYLARRPSSAMEQWRGDVEAARVLAGYIQNDSL